ncbi:hypothetical protein KAS41_00750 [Candidatus Parcubacteria bacterium]|nr:hypothetical protein [Candidatus Parcubacteria bacterium]
MSKIIEKENGVYIKPSFYKKYFKMNHGERKEYFKFTFSLIASLSVISIPLIIAFQNYLKYFLIGDLIIFILSVPFYFFLYKKKKGGVGIWCV